MFSLVRDLACALRCVRREEAFCESVTFSQFVILDEVGQRCHLDLCDLHHLLKVDKSTTTRLVKPLIAKGLVERRMCDRDRRAVELYLTEAGRAVHARVWQCLGGFMAAVERGVPAERRTDVHDSVRLLLTALRRAGEGLCGPEPCSGGPHDG
ncbi:MarR family winged helix-turn-helix transcriptional regulator [Planctomycetota bacterium]